MLSTPSEVRRAVQAAEGLFEAIAEAHAEARFVEDGEYTDPTDFADDVINNLPAIAYALSVGLPVTAWAPMKKNDAAEERALTAIRQWSEQARVLVERLADGQISLEQFWNSMVAEYTKQAQNAYVAGRRSMGNLTPLTPANQAQVTSLTQPNVNLLNQMAQSGNVPPIAGGGGIGALLSGMLTPQSFVGSGLPGDPMGLLMGKEGKEAAKTAVASTFGRTVETMGKDIGTMVHPGEMSALDDLPDDAVIVNWELGPTDHCIECIQLADLSPYTERALLDSGIFPGSGHTSCLPGDTPVAGAFTGGYRSWYEGQVVEIETAGGHRLTVTPGHPVATSEGFRPARQIKKGDQLICHPLEVEGGSTGPLLAVEQDDAPVTAQQVFESLMRLDAMDAGRMPNVGAEDFHGDARCFKGEVEVVGAARQLLRHRHATCPKCGSKRVLITATEAKRHLGRQRAAVGLLGRAALEVPSEPRRTEVTHDHRRPTSSPDGCLRRGGIAHLDARLAEPAGESRTADARFLGELLEAHPGLVSLDEVVEVRYRDWLGHVYDFSTRMGAYMARDVLVSNCGNNCACELSYDVPSQVCGDSLTDSEGNNDMDEALTFLEVQGGDRLNVWVQEAASCQMPMSVDSFGSDIAATGLLADEDAFDFDEDLSASIEGDVDDTAMALTEFLASNPSTKDLLAWLQDYMPDSELADEMVSQLSLKADGVAYAYAWRSTAENVVFDFGATTKGLTTLDPEMTMKALQQLGAKAAKDGKGLLINADTAGPGMRKWLDSLGTGKLVSDHTAATVIPKWDFVPAPAVNLHGLLAEVGKLPKPPLADELADTTYEAKEALGGFTDKALVGDKEGNTYLVKQLGGRTQGEWEIAGSHISAEMGLRVAPATELVAGPGIAGGVIQAIIPGCTPLPERLPIQAFASLNEAQAREALRQSVADYLTANNDTHAGNFLIAADGQLWGIDKGLAMRDMAHPGWNDAAFWLKPPEGKYPGTLFGEAVRNPAHSRILELVKPSDVQSALDNLSGTSVEQLIATANGALDKVLKPNNADWYDFLSHDDAEAALRARYDSATASYEGIFRQVAADPTASPEWKAWLANGGHFDGTSAAAPVLYDTPYGSLIPGVMRATPTAVSDVGTNRATWQIGFKVAYTDKEADERIADLVGSLSNNHLAQFTLDQKNDILARIELLDTMGFDTTRVSSLADFTKVPEELKHGRVGLTKSHRISLRQDNHWHYFPPEAMGQHPTAYDDLGGAFAHEYGHVILGDMSADARKALQAVRDANKEVEVSDYAKEDFEEWFGEVMAKMTTPGYQAGTLPFDSEVWGIIGDQKMLKQPKLLEPLKGEPKLLTKPADGLKPGDPQVYFTDVSAVPINAPAAQWSGYVPEEPPLPKEVLKFTHEEIAAAKAASDAAEHTWQDIITSKVDVALSQDTKDAEAAVAAGLVYRNVSGVRLIARDEHEMQQAEGWLQHATKVSGFSAQHEANTNAFWQEVLGYSNEDLDALDAYDEVSAGKRLTAGVVMAEPDGRIWVLSPKNEWAGYQQTWIKGGVDTGETAGAAAVREMQEEAGFSVELDSYLGDYMNTDKTGIARMYIGHRTGGGPLWAHLKETYKVRLLTPEEAGKALTRYGKPDARDQTILADALSALQGKPTVTHYVVAKDEVANLADLMSPPPFATSYKVADDVSTRTGEFAVNPRPKPVAAETSFGYDKDVVAEYHGKDYTTPPSSTKFPYATSHYTTTDGFDQPMYWKVEAGLPVAKPVSVAVPTKFETITVEQGDKVEAEFEKSMPLKPKGEAQKEAIDGYTGGAGVNSDLGFAAADYQTGAVQSIKDAATLDAMMAATSLPHDTMLYRGLGTMPDTLKVGDLYGSAHYLSTSVKPEVGAHFTMGTGIGGKVPTMLRIHAPADSHALWIGKAGNNPIEGEMLLPRGVQYRVVAVHDGQDLSWLGEHDGWEAIEGDVRVVDLVPTSEPLLKPVSKFLKDIPDGPQMVEAVKTAAPVADQVAAIDATIEQTKRIFWANAKTQIPDPHLRYNVHVAHLQKLLEQMDADGTIGTLRINGSLLASVPQMQELVIAAGAKNAGAYFDLASHDAHSLLVSLKTDAPLATGAATLKAPGLAIEAVTMNPAGYAVSTLDSVLKSGNWLNPVSGYAVKDAHVVEWTIPGQKAITSTWQTATDEMLGIAGLTPSLGVDEGLSYMTANLMMGAQAVVKHPDLGAVKEILLTAPMSEWVLDDAAKTKALGDFMATLHATATPYGGWKVPLEDAKGLWAKAKVELADQGSDGGDLLKTEWVTSAPLPVVKPSDAAATFGWDPTAVDSVITSDGPEITHYQHGAYYQEVTWKGPNGVAFENSWRYDAGLGPDTGTATWTFKTTGTATSPAINYAVKQLAYMGDLAEIAPSKFATLIIPGETLNKAPKLRKMLVAYGGVEDPVSKGISLSRENLLTLRDDIAKTYYDYIPYVVPGDLPTALGYNVESLHAAFDQVTVSTSVTGATTLDGPGLTVVWRQGAGIDPVDVKSFDVHAEQAFTTYELRPQYLAALQHINEIVGPGQAVWLPAAQLPGDIRDLLLANGGAIKAERLVISDANFDALVSKLTVEGAKPVEAKSVAAVEAVIETPKQAASLSLVGVLDTGTAYHTVAGTAAPYKLSIYGLGAKVDSEGKIIWRRLGNSIETRAVLKPMTDAGFTSHLLRMGKAMDDAPLIDRIRFQTDAWKALGAKQQDLIKAAGATSYAGGFTLTRDQMLALRNQLLSTAASTEAADKAVVSEVADLMGKYSLQPEAIAKAEHTATDVGGGYVYHEYVWADGEKSQARFRVYGSELKVDDVAGPGAQYERDTYGRAIIDVAQTLKAYPTDTVTSIAFKWANDMPPSTKAMLIDHGGLVIGTDLRIDADKLVALGDALSKETKVVLGLPEIGLAEKVVAPETAANVYDLLQVSKTDVTAAAISVMKEDINDAHIIVYPNKASHIWKYDAESGSVRWTASYGAGNDGATMLATLGDLTDDVLSGKYAHAYIDEAALFSTTGTALREHLLAAGAELEDDAIVVDKKLAAAIDDALTNDHAVAHLVEAGPGPITPASVGVKMSDQYGYGVFNIGELAQDIDITAATTGTVNVGLSGVDHGWWFKNDKLHLYLGAGHEATVLPETLALLVATKNQVVDGTEVVLHFDGLPAVKSLLQAAGATVGSTADGYESVLSLTWKQVDDLGTKILDDVPLPKAALGTAVEPLAAVPSLEFMTSDLPHLGDLIAQDTSTVTHSSINDIEVHFGNAADMPLILTTADPNGVMTHLVVGTIEYDPTLTDKNQIAVAVYHHLADKLANNQAYAGIKDIYIGAQADDPLVALALKFGGKANPQYGVTVTAEQMSTMGHAIEDQLLSHPANLVEPITPTVNGLTFDGASKWTQFMESPNWVDGKQDGVMETIYSTVSDAIPQDWEPALGTVWAKDVVLKGQTGDIVTMNATVWTKVSNLHPAYPLVGQEYHDATAAALKNLLEANPDQTFFVGKNITMSNPWMGDLLHAAGGEDYLATKGTTWAGEMAVGDGIVVHKADVDALKAKLNEYLSTNPLDLVAAPIPTKEGFDYIGANAQSILNKNPHIIGGDPGSILGDGSYSKVYYSDFINGQNPLLTMKWQADDYWVTVTGLEDAATNDVLVAAIKDAGMKAEYDGKSFGLTAAVTDANPGLQKWLMALPNTHLGAVDGSIWVNQGDITEFLKAMDAQASTLAAAPVSTILDGLSILKPDDFAKLVTKALDGTTYTPMAQGFARWTEPNGLSHKIRQSATTLTVQSAQGYGTLDDGVVAMLKAGEALDGSATVQSVVFWPQWTNNHAQNVKDLLAKAGGTVDDQGRITIARQQYLAFRDELKSAVYQTPSTAAATVATTVVPEAAKKVATYDLDYLQKLLSLPPTFKAASMPGSLYATVTDTVKKTSVTYQTFWDQSAKLAGLPDAGSKTNIFMAASKGIPDRHTFLAMASTYDAPNTSAKIAADLLDETPGLKRLILPYVDKELPDGTVYITAARWHDLTYAVKNGEILDGAEIKTAAAVAALPSKSAAELMAAAEPYTYHSAWATHATPAGLEYSTMGAKVMDKALPGTYMTHLSQELTSTSDVGLLGVIAHLSTTEQLDGLNVVVAQKTIDQFPDLAKALAPYAAPESMWSNGLMIPADQVKQLASDIINVNPMAAGAEVATGMPKTLADGIRWDLSKLDVLNEPYTSNAWSAKTAKYMKIEDPTAYASMYQAAQGEAVNYITLQYDDLAVRIKVNGWLQPYQATGKFSPGSMAQKEAGLWKAIPKLADQAVLDDKPLWFSPKIMEEQPGLEKLLKSYGAKVKTLKSKSGEALDGLDLTAKQAAKLAEDMKANMAGAGITLAPSLAKVAKLAPVAKTAEEVEADTLAKFLDANGIGQKKAGSFVSDFIANADSSGTRSYMAFGEEVGSVQWSADHEMFSTLTVEALGYEPSTTMAMRRAMLGDFAATAKANQYALYIDHSVAEDLGLTDMGGLLTWDKDHAAWQADDTGKLRDVLLGKTKAPEGMPLVKPEIAPPPLPPVVVPEPVVSLGGGLDGAYGYTHAHVKAMLDDMALPDSPSLKVTMVSQTPNIKTFQSAWGNGVTLKWSEEPWGQTRVLHVKQIVAGNADGANTAMVAGIAGQWPAYLDAHPDLARLLIDKKAVTNPGMEGFLKDSGFKETKDYWVIDRSKIGGLQQDIVANKADWAATTAIPSYVPPVPAQSGAVTSKIMGGVPAKPLPSFIYDYDPATHASLVGSAIDKTVGAVELKAGAHEGVAHEMTAGPITVHWSVSPSGKTIGVTDVVIPAGTSSAETVNGMFAALEKIAADAGTRASDGRLWVKPDLYTKVPGLSQVLKDAGASEETYQNIGEAIQMSNAQAKVLADALHTDSMGGLTISIAKASDYLGYNADLAKGIFSAEPLDKGKGVLEFKTGASGTAAKARTQITMSADSTKATIESITADESVTTLTLAAQINWLVEHGASDLTINAKIVDGIPKMDKFLVSLGATVEPGGYRLSGTVLYDTRATLIKNTLPVALGGKALDFSFADAAIAAPTDITAASHNLYHAVVAGKEQTTFTLGGKAIQTGWTKSGSNIYWESITPGAATVGQTRAASVAQLRAFVSDMGSNSSIKSLDVSMDVLSAQPGMRTILQKYGAKEVAATPGHAAYVTLARPKAMKLRTDIEEEFLGNGNVEHWPTAEDLTFMPGEGQKLPGQTDKELFKDSDGNWWLFKPGYSGQGSVTDNTASDLGNMLGLKLPSTKTYTLDYGTKTSPGSLQRMLPGSWPKTANSPKSVLDSGGIKVLNANQQQELWKHSVLDWLVGNDDAHLDNLLIDTDGHLWAIDKTRAWKEFGSRKDVLDINSLGQGGTDALAPGINKWWKSAAQNPSMLAAVHPNTMAQPLRALRTIDDATYRQMVRPVAELAAKNNPRYMGNVEKLLDDMVTRKNSTTADLENFVAKNLKQMQATGATLPKDWADWLKAGGHFNLDATADDLNRERMATFDSMFGDKPSPASLQSGKFSRVRTMMSTGYGSGVQGAKAGEGKVEYAAGHKGSGRHYGYEKVRPTLRETPEGAAICDEWEQRNEWLVLHALYDQDTSWASGSQEWVAQFRKWYNKDTGGIKLVRSTEGSGSSPAKNLADYTKSGFRNLQSSAIGRNYALVNDGVYLYVEVAPSQVFTSMLSAFSGAENEIGLADLRIDQVLHIRPLHNPMDMSEWLHYTGPVLPK
jgi:ADP-ribose pyrophosphatase YjhB (NUDIX family)